MPSMAVVTSAVVLGLGLISERQSCESSCVRQKGESIMIYKLLKWPRPNVNEIGTCVAVLRREVILWLAHFA